MNKLPASLSVGIVIAWSAFETGAAVPPAVLLTDGRATARMEIKLDGDRRTYELTSDGKLRDDQPPDKRRVISEAPDHATVRSGNVMFDGLYALAVQEALQNSVAEIKDHAYGHGAPIQLDAFQTGESWPYVWTRDLAYSVHLALAGFDPPRAVNSLLFKTSELKSSAAGVFRNQIIQDTGSGGSYPVSSDRVVWALGADATLKYLSGPERKKFLKQAWPILQDTIELDRRLIFDRADGLYRGEQSFLDWREQTYPGWTKDNVLAIAMSKSLSVNVANYFLLKTAAEYAGRVGQQEDSARYAGWAAELKAAINRNFFDPDAGLYSAYLLSDGAPGIRVRRYDLLGESLAILLGVADQGQARAILDHYPVGPHGPAVVWPQERTVPIYHNQAMWPFVTAYWTKAARETGHAAAVDAGVHSLMRQAALNLSNMENYDFVSGLAEVKGAERNGPVVNSRRQLWSVAGYLAMVQDVIFGLETSWEGIRFRPCITSGLRNELFASNRTIELHDFDYRNTRHSVRIHLPATNAPGSGIYAVQRVELNGTNVGAAFVSAGSLTLSNQWNIYLAAPAPGADVSKLNRVDVADERRLFAPAPPEWDASQGGGITTEGGRLTLHFRHPDASNACFNIYRNGRLCAKGIRQTSWSDPDPLAREEAVRFYAVEAVDLQSGNTSHLSPSRSPRNTGQMQIIPAGAMLNRGGKLVDGHHFENWGAPGDELRTPVFRVERSGRYLIRATFSNGSGPVNTSIACGVKKLAVLNTNSSEVATGYLIMPQSGDWKRWDVSSPVLADLVAGVNYFIHMSEDGYSRNMSSLRKNERYTAWPGGGAGSCNFINIAAIEILLTAEVY